MELKCDDGFCGPLTSVCNDISSLLKEMDESNLWTKYISRPITETNKQTNRKRRRQKQPKGVSSLSRPLQKDQMAD